MLIALQLLIVNRAWELSPNQIHPQVFVSGGSEGVDDETSDTLFLSSRRLANQRFA